MCQKVGLKAQKSKIGSYLRTAKESRCKMDSDRQLQHVQERIKGIETQIKTTSDAEEIIDLLDLLHRLKNLENWLKG
jgi:hypothetical protein